MACDENDSLIQGKGRCGRGESNNISMPRFQMPKSSPAMDDMAPQSMSFIGDEDSVDLSSTATSMKIQQLFQPHSRLSETPMMAGRGSEDSQLEASLGKLNISSGSRTYRIPSPTRPLMTSKSFQDPNAPVAADEEEANNGKGFYISFDNEAPKRPKPPLRTKRSPKKEASDTTSGHSSASTLDSGRSMDTHDRYATTTRRQVVESGDDRNYPAERPYGDFMQDSVEAVVPAPRKVNENNYSYSEMGYQHQQQPQMQPRKHLEDVTNYEPQTMHNMSYGSSPSEFSPVTESNGFTVASNRSSEGTPKPIIIPNANLDAVG